MPSFRLSLLAGLSLLFSCSHPEATFAQVALNEILTSNALFAPDPVTGEFADWVELYNSDGAPFDLSGWSLSDNTNAPAKWYFPAGTSVPAQGFLLVRTDGEGHDLHTNFRLAKSGEEIALFNPFGVRVDYVAFGEQQTDISFGRQTDGTGAWGYFTAPTPEASNNAATFFTDFVQQTPSFSLAGGFFDTPVTVSIKNLHGLGELRYTTDGSDPVAASPLYDQPLALDTTTVVKARIFIAGRIPGPVVTNTYFIGENFQTRGLAVLSLSVRPDLFFGADSGIYVQTYKPLWEVPVHLEFYEADGILGFHHDCGASVGGENAWILPEKMLNIFSRKQYGGGEIAYQIFPDSKRRSYGDLILRTSGSDWSYTLFRDGMEQGLLRNSADVDVQAFRPCATFINGKYFGIYNLREKQDKEYLEYHHSIDADSLDYIENDAEVKEGDAVAYQAMVQQLQTGLQPDAAFQAFDQVVDTKNYTDYIISQIFCANTSWGHNIALFRARSDTARWRWLLHDYDRGFSLANVGNTGMAWATATNGASYSNPPFATLFLRKMLENQAFKSRFIQRFADHLYVTYHPWTVDQRVNRHADWIRNEIPYHVARWAGTTSSYGDGIPSVAFWENEVAKLKTFARQRIDFMLQDLNSFFSLNGYAALRIEVSDRAQGRVRFDELPIPAYPWTGNYLRNLPCTLVAEARPGFNFLRWERSMDSTFQLVASGAWKYRDAATAPPTDWAAPNFDDGSWAQGPAQFGYGDGDEATVLNYGGDAANKTPAYFFRKKFTVNGSNLPAQLRARMICDDGAVVYLNGVEVWRYNMPAAPTPIAFTSLASTAITNAAETTWQEHVFSGAALLPGDNWLAVEVHQNTLNSSDLSFDFTLDGLGSGLPEVVSTNPSIEVTLGADALTMRAVFGSDGTCGVLPDTVSADLVLTAACSPYRAAGSVVVLPDVVLKVQPGVEVQFPAGADLRVLGSLEVQGQADSLVIFKSGDAAAWGAIQLDRASAAAHLDFLKIENASAGLNRVYFPAAISAYHTDMVLDHLDLREVRDNPVFSRNSDVTLTNSTLRSTVTGDCINVKRGHGVVENCFFEGATAVDEDAVDFDGVADGVVRNNVIHDFRGPNNDGIDVGEQCQNLLVEGNFIYHCLDKGVSVGQQSSTLIRNNTIAYTAIGVAAKDQSELAIDHCTIFGTQHGIAAYEKNPGDLGGSATVTNCLVADAALTAYSADAFSAISLDHCLSDTDTLSGAGNLSADPAFIQPTLYDFHLKPGSPALGAGTTGSDIGALSLPNYTGAPQLMFSEILYDDTLSTWGEFVEIHNPGAEAVDLSGYALANAVEFVFPAGGAIPANGYVVVARDASNFSGASFPVYEWAKGRLDNAGEAIHLFDASGLLVDFVHYENHAPWPGLAQLYGHSLELVSDIPDNHFASSWQASAGADGSPGAPSGTISTQQAPAPLQMTLFPCPATDWITVGIKGILSGKTELVVLDERGVVLFSESLSRPGGALLQEKISLAGLPKGNYFLVARDNSGHAALGRFSKI